MPFGVDSKGYHLVWIVLLGLTALFLSFLLISLGEALSVLDTVPVDHGEVILVSAVIVYGGAGLWKLANRLFPKPEKED